MRKVTAGGDPDFDLVERSKVGDTAAFEELLCRHYDRARALVFRLTDADRCDDLTQDVFLLAYRNIRRFRGQARFSTWLTRIAINLCRGDWRKRKRRREDRLDDLSQKVVAEKVGANPTSALSALAQAEKGERIDREIHGLRPKLRMAFILRYIEGHSLREVAAILGCKEGTVRSRLFNARQILKVRLKDLVT
jgi:RNA polymerase sigma-70 factor (ECF subfamily)